jgi:adenosylmethionine---8-amino-7-oxononanoate aminotransferase
VFLRPFGSMIYLTPSFTIDAQDLSALTGAVVTIVGERL